MTTATLHTFVRDRILSDNAEFQSFSDTTGYAAATRRESDPTIWASHSGIAPQMDAIERWARERGYSDAPTFTPPTTVADLQVGDVVRLVGEVWGESHAGTLATYSGGSYANGETGYNWYLNDTDWTWEFVSRPETATSEEPSSQVEVPEGLEFTEYHPALLPLFTKAALAADAAGYCNEYDQIASEIGAPSRDEIKQLAGKEFTITVPYTVTVTTTAKGLSQDDAIRAFRNGQTYNTIRQQIIDALGPDGQQYAGEVYSNVKGYQSQYQSNWTVTPAE